MRVLIVVITILALGVAACGGSEDDDPTRPVRDFFIAFQDLDAQKASDAVCGQYRDDVQAGLDTLFSFVRLGGDDAEIEIIDLKLEIAEETENEARVTASSGKIKIALLGEVQEQDITEVAASVRVVKENGKWLICDGSITEGLEP